MNFIKSKPYIVFLVFALLIVTIGYLVKDDYVNINIHDTYFVISRRDLSILLSIPYLSFWLIYYGLFKFKFQLMNWITVFHTAASILGFILLFFLFNLFRESAPGNLEAMIDDIEFNHKLVYGICAVSFILFAAQILFLINIVLALIKGRKYT